MHTNDLLRQLDVLKVVDVFNLSLIQLVYKQRNGLLPDVFKDYFKCRRDVHNVNTRNAHKLVEIKAINNHGRSTLKYKGAKHYNELPNSVLECNTLNAFKSSVKKHMKSLY